MHVMIDVETLGTRPDAALLQVAAIAFEPFSGGKVLNGKAFNQYVMVQDNEGSIDNGTVAFWLKQNQTAQRRVAEALEKGMDETTPPDEYGKAVQVVEMLHGLENWPERSLGLSWDAIGGVWSKGMLDHMTLGSAFARHGTVPPWSHWVAYDLRTLFFTSGGEPTVDWTGLIKHDAHDDCVAQIMQLQKVLTRA